MTEKTYVTTFGCMDGFVNAPSRKYMKRRFRVRFVDLVTEPGIVKILADLAEKSDDPEMEFFRKSFKRKLVISIVNHGSRAVSITAHGENGECLGYPEKKEKQLDKLLEAVGVIEEMIRELGLDHLDVQVIPLWINERELPEEVHVADDGSIYTRERLFAETVV